MSESKSSNNKTTEVETRDFDIRLTDGTSAGLSISRLDDYAEIRLRPADRPTVRPSVDPRDAVPDDGKKNDIAAEPSEPSNQQPESSLVALVADFSGSIFNSKTAPAMVSLLKAVAKRSLRSGADVLFVPFGLQSAAYVLNDHNVDKLLDCFKTSIDDVVRRLPIKPPVGYDATAGQPVPESRFTGSWKTGNSPSAVFTDPLFYGATRPRNGLARLQECLSKWKTDRGTLPNRLQILFVTDGAFSGLADGTPANQVLTDDFLAGLKQTCADLPVPPTLVYIGVAHDLADDARRIFDAFQTGHYVPVSDGKTLQVEADNIGLSRLGRLLEEVGLSTKRVPLTVDGKPMSFELDERNRGILTGVQSIEPSSAKSAGRSVSTVIDSAFRLRRDLAAATDRVEQLRIQYVADSKAADLRPKVQAEDATLTALLKRLPAVLNNVGTDESTWTRELVYAALRRKNALQQTAAAAAQIDPAIRSRLLLAAEQSVRMDQKSRFSASVAKAILRNEPRLRQFRDAVTVIDGSDRTKFDVQVQEEAVDDRHKGRQTTLHSVAPTSIANDSETEFLTMENWSDLYKRGDVRCHAFLLPNRPPDVLFHTPSRLRLQPTNTTVALETYRENVRMRIGVQRHAGLFDDPFVGLSSDEKYNVGLPTYSPNLEFAIRYKLKPLLGLLLAGHELAHTPRSIDIYVPAILSLWRRFKQTGSAKTLNDAMLLQNAYRHARRWLGVGNLSDPAARSSHRQLLLHLNNETGQHAFANCMEPMMLLLECAHRLPTAIKRAENGLLLAAAAAAKKSESKSSSSSSKTADPVSPPSLRLLPMSTAAAADAKTSVPKPNKAPSTPDSELSLAAPADISTTAMRIRDGVWRELTYIAARLNDGDDDGEDDNKKSNGSFHNRFVRPVAAAVAADRKFASVSSTEPSLFAKPVDRWPQSVVDAVGSVSSTDPSISKLVSTVLQPVDDDLRFADWLMRLSIALPADVWSYIDDHYEIPADLSMKLAGLLSASSSSSSSSMDIKGMPDRSVDNKPDNAAATRWLSFASARPSNSARRSAGLSEYETGTALLSAIREVLASQASATERDRHLADRLKESVPAHAASPLIISGTERSDLQRLAMTCTDSKDFSAGFRSIFRDQLTALRIVFETGVDRLDGSTFDETFDIALSNLYAKRASLSTLQTTGTQLPQDRCGFVNCPMFLQPCGNLMKHLESLGSDLPRGSPYRRFFSGMHLDMRTILSVPKPPSVDDFVKTMTAKAKTMVAADFAPRFDVLFRSIYATGAAHYCL